MKMKIKGKIDRKDLDKYFRSICLGIYKDVIIGTPVDTGRARGNWQIAVGIPARQEIARKEKGGASNQTREAEAKLNRPTAGKSVFMSNNVGYIMKLEEGHSSQARGFIDKALKRAKARSVEI
tara:strand:+ start:4045 stop:4413 length:369 start_codon:yes stop_codon:yes gene_type:complete